MPDRTCGKCGAVWPPEHTFCVACGERLPEPPVLPTWTESPRGPGWWRRQEAVTKAIVAGLSVVALALLTATVVLGVTVGDSETRIVSTTISTDATTDITVAQASQVGQGVSIASVIWTVTDVQVTDTLKANTEYYEPQTVVSEQGKFVVILMTLENAGKEPLSLTPYYLNLMDEQGRTFASWTDYYFYVPAGYEDYADLNPGFTGKEAAIFEVPEDASGFSLVVTDPTDPFGDIQGSIKLDQ